MEKKQELMDLINELQLVTWMARSVLSSLQSNGHDLKVGFAISQENVNGTLYALDRLIDGLEPVADGLLSVCRRLPANDE